MIALLAACMTAAASIPCDRGDEMSDPLYLDPDSDYIGVRLNRNAQGRVVIAFGDMRAMMIL